MINIKAEFLYKILKPISKVVFYNKFNVKHGDYVLPEDGKAFIIVGHHVSAFDPIILNGFSKMYIRFLYANANNNMKFRNWFLTTMDMIPFAKNSADFKSIRLLKARLDLNQAVGLYPEGGASWDGTTDEVILATSKLIKMMKVPVYGIKYNGAYLSKPRWGKNTRRGKVIMNTYEMFNENEINELNYKDIHTRLIEALEYNEFTWQSQAMVKFKGKDLAEYIERLLYKCPKCNSYNTFKSKGDHFKCSHCNMELKFNEYGFIEEQVDNVYKPYKYTLADWNKWQHTELISHLSGNFIEFERLSKIDKKLCFENVTLTVDDINQDKICFGVDHIMVNEEKVLFKDVKSQSITFGSVIEFFYENHKYHMEFSPDANMSIKLFYDCLEHFKGGA